MKLIPLLLAKLSMSVTPKILEYISHLITKLCAYGMKLWCKLFTRVVPFRDAFVSGNVLNPLLEMLRLYEFKPIRKTAIHALQKIGDKNSMTNKPLDLPQRANAPNSSAA